jgi:hypothetical protein
MPRLLSFIYANVSHVVQIFLALDGAKGILFHPQCVSHAPLGAVTLLDG